jgi:hypothetical protein
MSHTDARAQYPNLYALVAGYFHQDWDLDDTTWDAVLSRYVGDVSLDELHSVRSELSSLLVSGTSEDDLRLLVLHEFGSQYDPFPELSMHKWLEAVLHQITVRGGARFGEAAMA